MSEWTYPSELLERLGELGLAPRPDTPPAIVRDALNDLYRYELRRMREALRAGDIPKPDYIGLVIALRKKYWPLTLPVEGWERVCRGDVDAHRADPTAGE